MPADPYLDQAEIKVAGRSDLYIQANNPDWQQNDPEGYGALFYFGMQMDDTPLQYREFYNDVPGDSHGGPNGPPIDTQVLGRLVTVQFRLSVWNQRVRYMLESHGNTYATHGTIADEEIGELQFALHSYRLLIIPLKGDPMSDPTAPGFDESDLFFTKNFPCAVLSSPIEVGQGTKFSALSFTMVAHRVPPVAYPHIPGDPGQNPETGAIWNRNVTGLTNAMASRRQVFAERMAKARASAMSQLQAE